ncbi:MAG: EAL domain-containing protein, partial [Campylobacterales bacterium]
MDNNIILGSAALVSASISWGVCQSLSRKKKAVYENFIKEKISYYNELFDVLEDNLVLLDESNEIAYINSAMVRFLGLDKKEIPRLFPMPEVIKGNEHISLEDILKDIKINPYKFIINHGNLILYINHRKVSVSLYISQYHTLDINSKRKIRILIFKTNVHSAEKEAFEHRHKLTKLPNHLKLQKDLQNTFVKLHLNDRKLAIVSMEIDDFASLRAILGHEQTNNILVTFANYLNHMSQEFSFSVYHTIHNSFILFMDNINNETDIYSVINLIQDKLKTLYRMENSILHLTISVGIALYPTNSSTGELLDNSYKALSQAKDKGQGWVMMYKPVQKSHAYDELKLYNDMHSALKRNEFEIYYQPIVDSKTKKIVSAEALIRWKHPVHGMVRPDIFIPIMEKTGFIIKLGRYLIEEVLKQQKRWELFKFKQVPVSINLSLAELEKENFVQVVETQLSNHKVSSELIKYEITEGLAMENEERTYKQLTELRKLGINILLDDFGTGYTSFSYIKKIPANIIKIDRSLVI